MPRLSKIEYKKGSTIPKYRVRKILVALVAVLSGSFVSLQEAEYLSCIIFSLFLWELNLKTFVCFQKKWNILEHCQNVSFWTDFIRH